MRKLPVIGVSIALLVMAGAALGKEFRTGGPSGGEEVPPRDAHARGIALFELSEDGLALSSSSSSRTSTTWWRRTSTSARRARTALWCCPCSAPWIPAAAARTA